MPGSEPNLLNLPMFVSEPPMSSTDFYVPFHGLQTDSCLVLTQFVVTRVPSDVACFNRFTRAVASGFRVLQEIWA